MPTAAPLSIIPHPQRANVQDGSLDLILSGGVAWSMEAADPRLALAAAELRREWEQRAGVRWLPEGDRGSAGLATVRLDVTGETDSELRLVEAGLAVPADPEGFALKVDHSGAWVVGRTAAGAFYGLQALRQLLRIRDGVPVLRACRIEDWPAFRFRGAHLFPSARGLALQRQLIENVLARYRFNHLLLECEHVRWAGHPEIHDPAGATPEQVRELIAAAEARFITVTPLVASLGHCEWIFRNGSHLDLAEDPETPYAYCPRNEDSYRFILGVFDEALELFGNPARFHIGHDEVRHRGRFPHHPACRQQGYEALFAADVRRLHAHLQARGAATMLWGDVLVGPGDLKRTAHPLPPAETRRLLVTLPDDLTVVDWQYQPADRYPSLTALQGSNRRVIGATFHDPANIRAFALDALHQGAEGMLQTTWAGPFPDESVLRTHREQFTALVLAGDTFWHPRDEPVPYARDAEFDGAWG